MGCPLLILWTTEQIAATTITTSCLQLMFTVVHCLLSSRTRFPLIEGYPGRTLALRALRVFGRVSDGDLAGVGRRSGGFGGCQTGIRLIDFRATTSGGGSSMIPMGWGRGLVNPLCHHSIGTRETTMKM